MDTSEILFEYLRNILYNPQEADLDIKQLPPEFEKLGEGLQLLGRWIAEAREFSVELAKGNLDCTKTDSENMIIGPMKDLQATLRHLTWQTQQVAKGDYSQTVDFMGEFSEAFNELTAQLKERRRKETMIYQYAYTDVLTGLRNLRYAMEQMQHWMEEGRSFTLSFVDVDYLKYCNDTFGHMWGDQYLLDISRALETMGGILCRTGGDEFMLIEAGAAAKEQDDKLEKLRERVQLQRTNGVCPRSFSYASCDIPANPEKTLEEYILIVDTRMYQYKVKNKKPLADMVYRDDRKLD